jgi:hypothetical protein
MLVLALAALLLSASLDTAQPSQLDVHAAIAARYHAQFRAAVKLPPKPTGEVVVRIVAWPTFSRTLTSTVAVRTAQGWRVEQVRGERDTTTREPVSFTLAKTVLPAADAARLDALLATPALYAEPAETNLCFDGTDTLVEIRAPGHERTAFQACQMDGLTGEISRLLVFETFAAKR